MCGAVLRSHDGVAQNPEFLHLHLDVVARVEHKMGQCSAHVAQIQLEQCRVPVDQLLGEAGAGYRNVMGSRPSSAVPPLREPSGAPLWRRKATLSAR